MLITATKVDCCPSMDHGHVVVDVHLVRRHRRFRPLGALLYASCAGGGGLTCASIICVICVIHVPSRRATLHGVGNDHDHDQLPKCLDTNTPGITPRARNTGQLALWLWLLVVIGGQGSRCRFSFWYLAWPAPASAYEYRRSGS